MRTLQKNSISLPILGTLMGLIASTVAAASVDSSQPTDLAVAVAIKTKLSTDREFDYDDVNVSCENGQITLRGKAMSLLAHERAVEVSLSTRGVISVVNEMKTPLVNKSDKQLAVDVLAALANDPATDTYQLRVHVADAIATLTGDVESWPERHLAELAAKSVIGIQAIENKIIVDEAMTRRDDEIRADIERTYAYSIWIDEDHIDVRVSRGVVTLSGDVGSGIEKKRAYDAAWVAGVSLVVDTELKVDPLLQDRMRKRWKWATRSDDQIRHDVNHALQRDARVSASRVDVLARNGNVTLSGLVDNLSEKHAAQKDAENVAGVREVSNRLQVDPRTEVSDLQIMKRLNDRLLNHPTFKNSDVSVSVKDGVAVLRGHVNTPRERYAAIHMAERFNGVARISDQLDVKSNLRQDDAKIEADIRNRLHWSPFVSGRVAVEVDGGVATLRGEVSSIAERRVALLNAYESDAMKVVDELVVGGGEESERKES